MEKRYHLSRMGKVLKFVIFTPMVLVLACCNVLAPATIPNATPIIASPPPADTPAPTITTILTSTETPNPTSTPDRTATVAVAETAEMAAKMIDILPRLEKLGYGPESGNLIYTGESLITLTVDSYQEDKVKQIVRDPIQDFIFQANVRWNSTSGLAGCGIMFRAEEDTERGGNYQFLIMRLSGAPAYDIEYFKYGQYQYSLLPSTQFTAAIDERQDADNKLTLIVRSDSIESVINTTKGVDAFDKKLSAGHIGLMAWQESGKTTCTFSDVWVWELNSEGE